MLKAVAHDGAAGDDADEGAFVVDDGDEVLVGRAEQQLLHIRRDGHGQIVLAVADGHDAVFLGVAQVHAAQVFDRPQQVALGECPAIFAVAVEDGQGGVAGMLHALKRLAQGVVVVEVGAGRLRRQKK